MITKNIKHNLAVLAMGCGVAFTTAGCNDFLDVLPMNDVVLENYWTKESDVTSVLMEQGIEAEIEVITGSVEIAPAADIADAIFDIVSSGGTLVSNGLREVEKIFWSEAVLISSGKLSDEEQKVLDEMLFRFESAKVSRHKKYILMNLPQASVEEATRILPAMRSPTVMPLAAEGWCSMHSVVDEADLWEKIQQLKAIGAEGILVLNIDKIIP